MSLDPNHRFEFGKYKGLTVEDVLSLDSDYIDWCRESAPNLLKPKRKPAPAGKPAAKPFKSNKDEDGNWPEPPEAEKNSGLSENLNFLNEKNT